MNAIFNFIQIDYACHLWITKLLNVDNVDNFIDLSTLSRTFLIFEIDNPTYREFSILHRISKNQILGWALNNGFSF